MNQKGIVHLILILILVAGLIAGLYLVQNTQIFKPKASNTWVNAFEIKDANGNVINCDASTSPPTCETSTEEVEIKVKDLDALIQN